MNYKDLQEQANLIGLEITDDMIQKLKKYHELLSLWNEKMNLTAITEESEVIKKHFFDCIIPLTMLEDEGRLIDVGSGAGFPGLVFKIVRPNYEVTLLEPIGKRCNFLNEVIKELYLKAIEVINERSEDFAKENREVYDIATARAVANLNILSELCLPLVKVNGVFLAMKGSKGEEEHLEASKAIETLGAELVRKYEHDISGAGERVNLLYKKVKNTPTKYPRNYSQIKNKPIR